MLCVCLPGCLFVCLVWGGLVWCVNVIVCLCELAVWRVRLYVGLSMCNVVCVSACLFGLLWFGLLGFGLVRCGLVRFGLTWMFGCSCCVVSLLLGVPVCMSGWVVCFVFDGMRACRFAWFVGWLVRAV